MAYLDLNLMNIKSTELAEILAQIQWAINVLTKENFPNKLNGDDIIRSNSLSGTAIKEGTLNGDAIVPGTLDGNAIIPGTLDGNAIIPGTLDGNAIKLNTLDGAALINNSLPATKIADYALPLKKLNWREYPIPLVLSSQPVSTTSSLDCGGFFLYDPAKFPGGTWYLEAVLKAPSGTATAQLKNGSTVIGSVVVNNSNWTLARSSALTMPTSQASLTVTLTGSGSSYTAYLWTARLIYVPS